MFLSPVPFDALVQLDAEAAEAVQGAADGQVDLPRAQPGDVVEIGQVPAAAGVGDGDTAPLGQLCDEVLVDAALEALVVGCVDEELGAVGLKL